MLILDSNKTNDCEHIITNFEVVLMGTSLVVRSQVKNYAKVDGKPLNVAEDFYVALNKKVEKIIEEACKRAKLNSRNTLMGRDV